MGPSSGSTSSGGSTSDEDDRAYAEKRVKSAFMIHDSAGLGVDGGLVSEYRQGEATIEVLMFGDIGIRQSIGRDRHSP